MTPYEEWFSKPRSEQEIANLEASFEGISTEQMLERLQQAAAKHADKVEAQLHKKQDDATFKAQQQQIQIDFVHSHSGGTKSGQRWGYTPSDYNGNAVTQRMAQLERAAGYAEDDLQFDEYFLNKALAQLVEEGLVEWLNPDGSHYPGASFYRSPEEAAAHAYNSKPAEQTQEELEQAAYELPLEELERRAGRVEDDPQSIAAGRVREAAAGDRSGAILPGWVSPLLNNPNGEGEVVEHESPNASFFLNAIPGNPKPRH